MLAMVLAVTALLIGVTVVLAGGATEYGRWLLPGAVVYTDPDMMADVEVIITETKAVTVTLGNGWAFIVEPQELSGYYVQTQYLAKEEPVALKAQREVEEQKAAQVAYDAAMEKLAETPTSQLTPRQLLSVTIWLGSPSPVVVPSNVSVTSAVDEQMVTSGNMIWVRNAPSSTATVVRKLPLNTVVTVYEKKVVGGVTWVRIGTDEWMTTVYLVPSAAGASVVVNQATNFGPRDCLVVNGVKTCLEGQDIKDVRAMYHDETGIAKGQNYTIVVPKGWSLGIFGVSAEVTQEGGQPVQYTGGPALIIHGPWKGTVGAYEAGLHGVPAEWESFLTTQIFSVHKKYVPNAKITFLP